MKKKPSVSEYIEIARKTNALQGIVVEDISIEEKLGKTRENSKKLINKELADYFALLDLGITALEETHNVCKEKSFLYGCTSGKLVSQLLAMRILLRQGLMDSVKPIYRSFHEMMEIFFACLIDENFAQEYGKTDEMYDNKKFWKDHINGNKLDKYINSMFDILGYPKEAKKQYFRRRNNASAFLSEAVHASFNSAFSAYQMITLDAKMSTSLYGKVTTAYPTMMYELLTDICLINAVFFLAVDNEKAYAFEKKDFVGEKWLRYHYYMKLYDVAYEVYYQDLYKKGNEINQLLQDVYDYVKKIEEGETEEEAAETTDDSKENIEDVESFE